VALLALALGIALPAVAVIWFMTEAASNQSDAARQRLSDALRGQLRLLRERLESGWTARVARLREDASGDAASFHRLVTSGGVDSLVRLEAARGAYAVPPAPAPSAGDPKRRVRWQTAAALEASGNYGAAAAEYAVLATDERNASDAARAAQAHVRALVGARDETAALDAIGRYFSGPPLVMGVDRHGRLIAADARLMALRLLRPSDRRWTSAVERLAAMVNDYRAVALPPGQRLFLMGELAALAPDVVLPTHAAERLAAEFLERDGSAPASEALEPSRLPGVWKMSIGGGAVGLWRTATVERIAHETLNEQGAGAGTRFFLAPPGRNAGAEAIAASSMLPGWLLGFSLVDAQRLDREAGARTSTYLWAGSTVVAGLTIAGLLLWQAFRRQMHVNRLKTDLVAAVSHELRTPLASMRALVDLMLEDPGIDRKKSREYLQMIAGENARLGRLIEHFLAFSRVDRDGYSLVFRGISAHAVVQQAVSAPSEPDRFPGIVVDVPPDLSPLYGDEDALVTVLSNLLENAYKYTGDDKRVVLRARQEGARVVFEVEDNGIGIARREQKRIFRPFYQVDQRLARERGGCGLGLSIVDFVVRAHGGAVTVRSEPGAGSVFRIVLPARTQGREAVA
jgi:signal transduction histidine kinase